MYKIILLAAFALGFEDFNPANYYFDKVLREYPTVARSSKLDPIRMKDINVLDFEDEFSVSRDVKVNFTDGLLTGLANASRKAECKEEPGYSYGKRSYSCNIVFSNLHASYSGQMTDGEMPKVFFNAESEITGTTVFVQVFQSRFPSVMHTYQIKHAGTQKVKFTGLGPLNIYTEILEEKFKKIILYQISNLMNDRVKEALGKIADREPF